MRLIERCERVGNGFSSTLPEPNVILSRDRAPHTLLYEIGEVGQWYHRELYLLYSPDSGLPLEIFVHKMQDAYTLPEAQRLFCEKRRCSCCPRHLTARPDYPFDHRCVSLRGIRTGGSFGGDRGA